MLVGVTSLSSLSSRPLAASQMWTHRPAAVTNERACGLYSPAAIGESAVYAWSTSSGPSKHQRRRAAMSTCRCCGSTQSDETATFGGRSDICSSCERLIERMSHTQTSPAASTERSCAVRPIAATCTIGAEWPRSEQMIVSESGFHARSWWSRPAEKRMR